MNIKIFCKDIFVEFRAKKGFTVRGIAKAAGVNAACIQKIEMGGATRPSTANKICKALNCDFDTVFTFHRKEIE